MTPAEKLKDVNSKVEEVATIIRCMCPRMALADYSYVKSAVRMQWIKHHGLDVLGRKRFNQ